VVEQRDIEIFLTLAEELHFGRTAERLHVSTARVSQTIKKLERRIGAALFERTSRQVRLTPIGRRLDDDLRPAYQQIREGIDRAIASGRGVEGVLRVGFIGTAVGQFLHQAAETFHARYPACQVQIREARYSDFLELLRADEIDVMLVPVPVPVQEPDLACSPVLFREPSVLAVSARHPLARRASVSLEDLAADKVLRPRSLPDYMEESLIPRETPAGRPIERGPEFNTVQEMLSLVGAGKGIFPVPAHARSYDVRPDITYVPIRDGLPRERRLTGPSGERRTCASRPGPQLFPSRAHRGLPSPGRTMILGRGGRWNCWSGRRFFVRWPSTPTKPGRVTAGWSCSTGSLASAKRRC
jgi:DNA-binding transcriptional LysR family regulator